VGMSKTSDKTKPVAQKERQIVKVILRKLPEPVDITDGHDSDRLQ